MASFSACSTDGAEPGAASNPTAGSNDSTSAGANALAADVLGTWVSDEKGTPKLVFEAAGTVTGTDGCNGIATTYSVASDKITLKEFASTRMACQGVNDWLRSVREVAIDGDTLLIFNNKGEEIGTLSRDS